MIILLLKIIIIKQMHRNYKSGRFVTNKINSQTKSDNNKENNNNNKQTHKMKSSNKYNYKFHESF
jgi:hypothetical protein